MSLAGRTDAKKPVLPTGIKRPSRLVLDLWRARGSFRHFLEFAVIGAIVLAFLHGWKPDISALWGARAPAQQEPQAAEPIALPKNLANLSKSGLPAVPRLSDVMFDDRYFAALGEPLRSQLVEATRAYAARDYGRALDVLASADPNSRHVLLVKGVATIAPMKPEDVRAGIGLIERAIELGEPKAMAVLGVLKLQGFVGIPRDASAGRQLLERAAIAGDGAASRVLGLGYITGWAGMLDATRAATLLRNGAELGDVEATYLLAMMLSYGNGVAKDTRESERLMLMAAEAGHRDAQAMLGIWRLRAYSGGLTNDPRPALVWLDRAAERGQPYAMLTLGAFYLYSKPETGYHDPVRAAELLGRCAETTLDENCAFAYATILEDGRGLSADRVKAYAYYGLSDFVLSTPAAKERMQKMATRMSPDEIARAESLIMQLHEKSLLASPQAPGFEVKPAPRYVPNQWHPFPDTHRYRLTVHVEVDGELKSGSGVIQVAMTPSPSDGPPTTVDGEAVVLDLGPRGMLFVLLSGADNSGAADITRRTFMPTTGGGEAANKALSKARSRVELQPSELPALVTFKDIGDPQTIVHVRPDDLASAFGPGVRFVSATIELTDDPVTRRIDKVLPWLSAANGGLGGRFASTDFKSGS